MPGAQTSTWRDTEYLVTGTQKGFVGGTITDRGKDFKSCGVAVGLAVKNVNQSTSGLVTSVTEDTVGTDISFATGETYQIFKTTAYNTKIETHYEDKRAGHKVTNTSQTEKGVLVEDIDMDEYESNVFGPGQPEK